MVHNHGTEDGEGLACPETRLPDGTLQGKCMARKSKSEIIEELQAKLELHDAPEIHNENTLFKVFAALRRLMDDELATCAINEMQNEGILFRERG